MDFGRKSDDFNTKQISLKVKIVKIHFWPFSFQKQNLVTFFYNPAFLAETNVTGDNKVWPHVTR